MGWSQPRCSGVDACSWLTADWTNSLFAGSKSDGQRSPNDTVFLRMDEIPYIREDRPESYGDNGERALYYLVCLMRLILLKQLIQNG